MVCLQSSIVHFWRKSCFIPCEIGLYDGILELTLSRFNGRKLVVAKKKKNGFQNKTNETIILNLFTASKDCGWHSHLGLKKNDIR